jgi:hypothetical protein
MKKTNFFYEARKNCPFFENGGGMERCGIFKDKENIRLLRCEIINCLIMFWLDKIEENLQIRLE